MQDIKELPERIEAEMEQYKHDTSIRGTRKYVLLRHCKKSLDEYIILNGSD